MIFHLTSRIHRREHLLVPAIRGEVTRLIRTMVGRTDAELLAYAVMPNHIHVILRQGPTQLSGIMQPLLRRVAHRVQAHHDFEGAVVERRYRDQLCATPEHVREAIVYVHLNPMRAHLCGDDLDYDWTSHCAYLPGISPADFGVDPIGQLPILALFAQSEGRTRAGLCGDYLAWLRYRIRQDKNPEERLPRPDTRAGDATWHQHFGQPVGSTFGAERALPDIRDFILAQLPRLAPGHTLESLRGSWLSRPAARSRGDLIRAAARRGYRTCRIAELFAVSPATVSIAKYATNNG